MEHHRLIQAEKIFRRHGGMMRTQEAMEAGISSSTIYAMHQRGVVDKITRGLYSLSDYQVPNEPDFVVVAKKIPRGVICLLSALVFHQLTTQMPGEIYVMLDRKGKKAPKLDYPPVHFISCSSHLFSQGIESHVIGGVNVKITTAERTLVDCFKFRNTLGLDIAIEALKHYLRRREPKPNLDLLMQLAKACRVDKIMQPYIEALINE